MEGGEKGFGGGGGGGGGGRRGGVGGGRRGRAWRGGGGGGGGGGVGVSRYVLCGGLEDNTQDKWRSGLLLCIHAV